MTFSINSLIIGVVSSEKARGRAIPRNGGISKNDSMVSLHSIYDHNRGCQLCLDSISFEKNCGNDSAGQGICARASARLCPVGSGGGSVGNPASEDEVSSLPGEGSSPGGQLVSMHGFFKTGLVYGFMVKQEIFSSYAEDIASSFSAFNNLADKTKGLGGTVSGLPNSLVPIGKLDEVLAARRQGGDAGGIPFGNVRRDGQLGAVLPGKSRHDGKTGDVLSGKGQQGGKPGDVLPGKALQDGKPGAVLSGKARHDGRDSADSLVLEHISVTIGDKEILRDICCRIPLGSKVAVIGENGSGKSTLLKAMAGLYRFQNGYTYGFGRRTAYIPAEELLFQGHSIWENISYGREHISEEAIKRQLGELRFREVEELCGKVPAQLSGGEAKRISIARGLPGEAEVILADEPDSCLDQETAGCVMRMLLALKDRTVIYITHNPEHAKLADMVIFIQDGEIRQVMEGEYERNAYFCGWSNAGKQCLQGALDG